MIEFHVADYGNVRKIVKELRPLVEKRRIVFVPFDNKMRSSPQPIAGLEIFCNAADQKVGLRPALWRAQEIMDVVVVLPCVPVTTMEVLSRSRKDLIVSGNEA